MTASGKDRRPPALVAERKSNSEDIDTRLAAAIVTLRGDRKLPATEQTLVDLSGASRGTVRSRSSVMKALRDIKEERKLAKPMPVAEKVINLRDELETLKKQVAAARDETQVQFNKREASEAKFRKLEAMYAQREAHMSRLTAHLAALGGVPSAVVPFRKKKAPPKKLD